MKRQDPPPGDLAELLARDRAARAEAQTRFDLPLVLEAGAGTGKTTTLVARLLAWCLGDGWEKAARGAHEPAGAVARAAAAGVAAPAVEVSGAEVPAGESPAGETPAGETSAGELSTGGLPAGKTPATGSPARETPAGELPAAESPATAEAAIELPAAEATASRVLRRVVALTFTEAAAAEMAGRAARELLALGRGAPATWLAAARLPPAPETARRARALVAVLDHLTVETIHAWCFRLLIAYPLEAGVHPRLEIDADGRLLQDVISETVESILRSGYGAPGEPHLLALAANGYGPREVAEALAALIEGGMTAAALRLDPFAGDAWECLRRRLAAAAGGLHQLLAPRLAGSRLRNAAGILEALQDLAPDLSPPVPDLPPAAPPAPAGAVAALQQRFAAALPPNLRKHLQGWGRCRLGRQEEDLLGDVRGELAERAAAVARLADHLDELDPERLRNARLALAPLLAAVEDELRRRGVATFDALLRDAGRLLAVHPEVRARLRRGIDQLLVDEFQDTDALQCEVLRWIALDGPPGERPGLFLVGDPKQSIYGWRSADLRAYEGFVAKVEEAGGEVRLLVESFRSAPPVLDEVARVVGPLMSERRGIQPPFAPLLACAERAADPGFTAGGRAPVEHWVSWPPASPAGQGQGAAALEAEAIARDLLELHDRHGVPWRDAAVLLRSTGDLETYLDALRRAGIPFAVGRDKQYYRRREVVDAAALVRAVIDPGDHLALVTALRSPAIGVPDAALLPLWRHQLPRLLTELHEPAPGPLAAVRRAVEAAAGELPREVPGIERVAGWELNLLAAVEQLARLRAAFAAEPVDLFVERLRRLLLLDATAAARYLGGYRLANLERFFRRLLAELEQGSGDVAAVLRALRGDLAAGRDAEEGRPPESAEDAVQVLTIHGAKGLDFAHVYLPQLHKPGGGERPATAVGRLPAAGGAAGSEYRLLGAATPGFDLVEERRLEVEAAERVRTLYVAMTRAKDRLVLAGDWPRLQAVPDRGSSPEQARTHLQLLAWRAGCPDLQLLWAVGEEVSLDADGVAWRFPALAGPPAAPAADAQVAPDAAAGTPAEAGAVAAAGAPAAVGSRAAAGAPAMPSGNEVPGGEGLATPAAVVAQSALLAARRAAAAARMARPFGAAASEEAHAQLREAVAAAESPSRRFGDGAPPAPAAADREAAMAAGAALHRALELWDLGAEPVREADRQRALLPAYLSAVAAGEEAARALPRCRRLLERFVAGGLAARLRALAGGVLARELPVLLAPSPEIPGGVAAGGAAGFVSGTVDLLYRDPASGELVIADYKSDDVSGAELAGRAAIYATQGAVYVGAVQAALGLAAPPRFELWFVHAGEVVTPAVATPAVLAPASA